jgi:hypothetical protein
MQESSTLATSTSLEGEVVTFTCKGSAETHTLSSLSAVLDGLHSDAVNRSARTVIADVRGLEFASSSCLKLFVTWLQRVIELDDDKRYKIKFRSNPAHSWQRRSLGALSAFAAGVVTVETEAQ